MAEDLLELYRSSNADSWFLRRGDNGVPVVRHVPNAASGGVVSELPVSQFLTSNRFGPEHEALLDLVAQLIPRGKSASSSCGVGRSPPARQESGPDSGRKMAADALLLTATRVCTFAQQRQLTNASGFFFERDERLYLVTSRHVLIDEPSRHFPDRLEIEFHVDIENLGASKWFSIPLYAAGRALWHQGSDTGGDIDVGVVEITRDALPPGATFCVFGPEHLPRPSDVMPIGASLLIVGFPLGFHDSLHHLPVVRQGVLASAFGLRFQGKGCFITDARTHRGTSGAPVVMSAAASEGTPCNLPWTLLGVHSSSIDMGSRDLHVDESLGLNSAWYADILMTLTES
ncbi:S1 family peptidase [Trinickia mobilis]|uniref:S1 family peptidase n=1 Tax=Trinickia mobilis TaxID=2816356 RepID=UPI002867B820|nr:serine protease [Trinickia mobilis]